MPKSFSLKYLKNIVTNFWMIFLVHHTIMLTMAEFLPLFHKVFPFWKIGHFFCPFFDFGNTFDPFLIRISALTEQLESK